MQKNLKSSIININISINMHCQLRINFGNLHSLVANKKTDTKRTNPSIGKVDVEEVTDKPSHKKSKPSRKS